MLFWIEGYVLLPPIFKDHKKIDFSQKLCFADSQFFSLIMNPEKMLLFCKPTSIPFSIILLLYVRRLEVEISFLKVLTICLYRKYNV